MGEPMTTPRENLLGIFRHQMPEWTPVCGHCDPYNQPSREGMDEQLAKALGTVTWCGESTVLFSRALGLDIMDYRGAPVRITQRKLSVQYQQEGPDAIEIWQTPHGALRQVMRRCREDGTSYFVEHLVKGVEDLKAFAAIFEDQEVAFDAPAAEAIARHSQLIGQDGMVMCFLPGTPLGMMYRVYSGVQTLAYLYADAPQGLGELFAVMERYYQRQFELAAASAADAFVTMDDTSTNVISPGMFEQFNMELTDARAQACHRAGKLYFHHSCGLIRDLLTLYRATKMDAVHAFSVPPLGNVSVAEGRRKLGDRITIIASIGCMADAKWDLERVRTDVGRFFTEAGAGDHFVLGLAAFPHRTMAQTRAVVEECRKYRKQPAPPRSPRH